MYLNTPLRSVYEWRRVVTGLKYGVEIEVEQAQDLERPRYWTLTEDGSLRNRGMEMVSVPLAPDDLDSAFEAARIVLERSHCVTNARCGIHLHMNVQDLAISQALSLLTGYTLVEPYLFKRFAPTRITSAFCVPMYLNDHGLMHMFRASVAARVGRYSTMRDQWGAMSKYSALNTRCIGAHGTMEFRALPGTLDMEAVREWVDVLTCIYEAAESQTDPHRLIQQYEGDPERFHIELFDDYIEPTGKEHNRVVRAANLIAGPESQETY